MTYRARLQWKWACPCGCPMKIRAGVRGFSGRPVRWGPPPYLRLSRRVHPSRWEWGGWPHPPERLRPWPAHRWGARPVAAHGWSKRAVPPIVRTASPAIRRLIAVPGPSCRRSVEFAVFSQQKTGKKEGKTSPKDRHAFPRVRLDLERRGGAAGICEDHLRDRWVAQPSLGAALVGHFDLDGVGAGIQAGEGHGGLHLLREDLLGAEIRVRLDRPLGKRWLPEHQVGTLRLDIHFLPVQVVAVRNDPANTQHAAIHPAGGAIGYVGVQKVAFIGFHPAHPPGLCARRPGQDQYGEGQRGGRHAGRSYEKLHSGTLS